MTDALNGAGIIETILDQDDAEIAEIADAEIARLAYAIDLISHRCPELGPADLALLGYSDEPLSEDELIPVEIADRILNCVMALDGRMERLEAQVVSGSDLIASLWEAMADCTLPEKQSMLSRLEGLIEMEASSHATLQ